jgi:hypothetical protein
MKRRKTNKNIIMIGYVYKIENMITGDFYIGKTEHLAQRIKSHKRKSSNKKVRLSMEEYGAENHVLHILHCDDNSEGYISMCEIHEINSNVGNAHMMNVDIPLKCDLSCRYTHPKKIAARTLGRDLRLYWIERFKEVYGEDEPLPRNEHNIMTMIRRKVYPSSLNTSPRRMRSRRTI